MSIAQLPVAQMGVGTMFDTYTTAKTILAATAVVKIPANTLWVGKRYRITALISLKNVTTAQPTFTFQVVGGPTSNIIVWQSGALVATTTAHTGIPCKVVVDLKCATLGAGTSANYSAFGEVTCIGLVLAGAVADPTVGMTPLLVPNATVALPSNGAAGFNSTADSVLDFFVGIGTSNSGNGVQMYDYLVEDLNGP